MGVSLAENIGLFIMREINRVIIHCSDTYTSQDIGVSEIKEWHEARGFSDIGYHYVIRRDGSVEGGRSLAVPGAHTLHYNLDSIGVCLVGGKPMFNFTRKQMESLVELVWMLVIQYNLKISDVHGHNEYSKKTCPNFNVREFFREAGEHGEDR